MQESISFITEFASPTIPTLPCWLNKKTQTTKPNETEPWTWFSQPLTSGQKTDRAYSTTAMGHTRAGRDQGLDLQGQGRIKHCRLVHKDKCQLHHWLVL